MTNKIQKKNVSVFNRDVSETGSYAYTGARLSSFFSNSRTSCAIADIYQMKGKRLLDLGCGDGICSLDLIKNGAASVLGVDPSEVAVAAATKNAHKAGFDTKITFQIGNIYDLALTEKFDCIVLRGVLHHLPDAAKALQIVAPFANNILIVEPNGANPIMKLIEKKSQYHIEHEEQSFLFSTIKKWLTDAGMNTIICHHVNLVPLFCPDWMARILKTVEPLVEALPLIRNISCGQYIILASKK